jgi:hypothetical protein
MNWNVLLVGLWMLVGFSSLRAQPRIVLSLPSEVAAQPAVRHALPDVVALLQQMFPTWQVDTQGVNQAQVVVRVLPVDTAAARSQAVIQQRTFDGIHYPAHGYQWRSQHREGQVVLALQAQSYPAVAFALYGLLQERLGASFYHPRETYLPRHAEWPLPDQWVWDAQPRFDKKGFHIHSQHPLEITEDLHQPYSDQAQARIREYITWLVRNGQNTFQFYMLSNIDPARWGPYSKLWVDYAHERGVLCGLKMSLHSIQQEAFQLYDFKPREWGSFRRQFDNWLHILFQAPWDYISPDLSLAEFMPGLGKKRSRNLQEYLIRKLHTDYGAHFMYNTHVISDENVIGTDGAHDNPHMPHPIDIPELGILPGVLIHTVMFYGITWPQAPTYGSRNLRFMWDYSQRHVHERELWYFPESAYWITFDNSLPLLLLPYLQGRVQDIDSMARIGCTGHVTFTSGWEWGYWLVDWTIARASWAYSLDGQPTAMHPTERVQHLFGRQDVTDHLTELTRLQMQYLVDHELMRYMTATTVTDEMGSLSTPYEPQPDWKWGWLERLAPPDTLLAVWNRMDTLQSFADQHTERLHLLSKLNLGDARDTALFELTDALWVTNLRAMHRATMVRYLTLKSSLRYSLGGQLLGLIDDSTRSLPAKARRQLVAKQTQAAMDSAWTRAQEYRATAQARVPLMELRYRYPADFLAARRPSVTSYQHGYLVWTRDLHFWQREEQQYRRGRYDFLFKNTWSIARIVGVWPPFQKRCLRNSLLVEPE